MNTSECSRPECLFCVMKENVSPSKRRSSIAKFFKELPNSDEPGQVLAVSGLWNTAMLRPSDGEFVELGIFNCMATLIERGIRDRAWLQSDQNIYIPYYAAHIIGSYTMVVEEFAIRAGWSREWHCVHWATWHRLTVHCVIFWSTKKSRGLGGREIESKKAEEWASQLQCWSLQLINCYVFKENFLRAVCAHKNFLCKLPSMWGGHANDTSPAGIGLLRSICRAETGRLAVATCSELIKGLCNVARSCDDWQFMAVDCLVWLVQDPATKAQVLETAAAALADIAELATLSGGLKKNGEAVVTVLLEERPAHVSPKEDLQVKHAAALVVKLEGNSMFASGDVAGAATKYSEALALCPLDSKKDRACLRALCLQSRHSESLWRRAQAYAVLQLPKESLRSTSKTSSAGR